MRTKITEELIAEIRRLRATGMIYSEIAETLGIGKTTASKYSKMVAKPTALVEIEDIVGIPYTRLVRKEEVKPRKLSRKERKAIRKRKRKALQ